MKRNIVLSLTLACLFTSCSDVLEKYPLDRPSQETFYNTAAEIMGGVNACYEMVRDGGGEQFTSPMSFDLMSDIGFARNGGDVKSISVGEFGSRLGLIEWAWKRAYAGIARCNLMLEVLEKKGNLISDDNLKQFKGEVLFLRAYYYTKLVQYWGDVPLVLKPISTMEDAKSLTRTPKKEVIDQLMADYTEAANLLPLSYANAVEKGRATKGSANSLKARAALYFGMFDVAAASAKEVIDSREYALYPKYGDLFVSKGLRDGSNKEIIMADDFSAEIKKFTEIVQVLASRSTGGWSTAVPTQSLIDSYLCSDGKNINESPLYNRAKPFENRDPRLKLSMVVPGERFGDYRFNGHADSTTCYRYSTKTFVHNNDSYANNQFTSFTGYLSRKYNDEDYLTKNTQVDNPLILCRYAEVLLTYAEAKIELNQIDQSVIDALNAIRRDRADVKMPALSLTDLGSQAQARKLIRSERKIELAFEGFRFMDLRRWGLADKYMNQPVMGRAFKGAYSDWPRIKFDDNNEPVYDYDKYKAHPSTDYRVVENRIFRKGIHELWPIPQTEINMNKKLIQNHGY